MGLDLLRRVGRRRDTSPSLDADTGLVVVPVSGHAVDTQVLRLAGVMARRQASEVLLIHVVEVPRSLPIDSEYHTETSHHILEAATRAAALLGFRPETELLQSRDAGGAIVDEARALNADLILLGLPRLTSAGQPSLGKTVPYVLLHAHCRVVVVRP